MNKINPEKINFNDDNFVIGFSANPTSSKNEKKKQEEIEEGDLIINRAKEQAQDILLDAQKEAQDFLLNAQNQAQAIVEKAQQEADEVLEKAQKEASEIQENAQKEAQELLLSSQNELEQIKIQATKDGYEEGHKDGLDKIQEEMEEKVEAFSKFCAENTEIKNKVLKSTSRDIFEIITNISKKILYKELNAQILDEIIKKTISNLEKKEDVTIIVSEKYAKLLFELQNKSLDKEIEFKPENFRQYNNFNIVFNPKYSEDTIIIENLKERFDASLASQLDIIIRQMYEQTKNGQLDLEQYLDTNETE